MPKKGFRSQHIRITCDLKYERKWEHKFVTDFIVCFISLLTTGSDETGRIVFTVYLGTLYHIRMFVCFLVNTFIVSQGVIR